MYIWKKIFGYCEHMQHKCLGKIKIIYWKASCRLEYGFSLEHRENYHT